MFRNTAMRSMARTSAALAGASRCTAVCRGPALSSAAGAIGMAAGVVRFGGAPHIGFTAAATHAALGASATMALRPVSTTAVRLGDSNASVGNGAKSVGASEGLAEGLASSGGAGDLGEELRRARPQGTSTTANTSLAITAVDLAGPGAAPADDSSSSTSSATVSATYSAAGSEKKAGGVQFQTGFRPLSKVADISESDRELIRKALRNEPGAPARSEEGEGVRKRMGGVGHGVYAGDMAAVFTCDVCQSRTVKKFTKHAYTKGVVMVQCPGCGSKHLLADNLGWFEDEHKTIEDILRAKGQEVKRLEGSIFLDEDC